MRAVWDSDEGDPRRAQSQYSRLPGTSPVLRAIVLIVAFVLHGLTAHASAGAPDLARLTVDRVQTVALSECREGVELAARGVSPMEIAIAVARPFEGLSQEITQANNRSENPSSWRVVVLRDGLLDDAIRSER